MHGLPEIHAHRAGPVVAGAAAHAEQTLPAFARTWAAERVACELDVRFTADGVPVVFHDATLQRVTGLAGRLDEIDAAAFRRLRADVLGADRHLARAPAPVPLATLDDVLRWAHVSGAPLTIELKNLPGDPGFDPGPGAARALAAALRASGMPASRLTLQSFWAPDVAELGARLPGARRSLLVAAGEEARGLGAATAAEADAIGVPWPIHPIVLRAARERGLAVMTYTVNDPAAMREAARAGVDAVITDDPATARRVLHADAASLPAPAAAGA